MASYYCSNAGRAVLCLTFCRQNQVANKPNPATAIKTLYYIFRIHIFNTDTEAMITKAMAGRELSLWPGTKFAMSTDEGKALRGTPHGGGASFLLAQHKNQRSDALHQRPRTSH